jgi:hypothetical protein
MEYIWFWIYKGFGEVHAWEHRINGDRATIDWKFSRKQAGRKLHYSATQARY